jgi:hypothetical protein
VRGKVNAKDREGNIGEEVKIAVDDAREITSEQATSYQLTGRKLKVPSVNKKAVAAVAKASTSESTDHARRIYVRMTDSSDQALLLKLKQLLDQSPGETDVVLVLGPPSSKQIIKLPVGVKNSEDLINNLKAIAGSDHVRLH